MRGGLHHKWKSAIHVARHFLKRVRNYAEGKLWARGYFVDSVGRNADAIRNYIKNQEAEDRRLDELDFGPEGTHSSLRFYRRSLTTSLEKSFRTDP